MSERPNFVLFFPDQWRADCLSSRGHPVAETPYVDQIAAEGVTFTSAFAACPSCIAARACLANGQTPSTVGRLGYRDKVTWRYPHTMMRVLRDGGYQTMCAGKTHFWPMRARLGFEELRIYDTGTIDPTFKSDYHEWLERETRGLVRDTVHELSGNSWLAHPWEHAEELHPSSWTASAAIELLEKRDPLRPFFLQVSFHRPHPPIDPPVSYFRQYERRELPPVPVGDWAAEFDHPVTDVGEAYSGRLPSRVLDRTRRAYYAQCAHLDFQVGRIFTWLRKHRLLEDTWLIFTSDHGELLGDHHLFRKANGFQGSADIPLLIRPPRDVEIPRGKESEVPTTHMDIMPTVLEAAGVEAPKGVEGDSLLAPMRGETVGWREFVHGEHTRSRAGWQFVTDGREKYIWDSLSGREWFFDLGEDPRETWNRAGDPAAADRVAEWRARLIEVLAARPEDGLVVDGRLAPGKIAPTVRPELEEEPGK